MKNKELLQCYKKKKKLLQFSVTAKTPFIIRY